MESNQFGVLVIVEIMRLLLFKYMIDQLVKIKIKQIMSMFDRYGFEAISQLISQFYENLLKVDHLKEYFKLVDMQKLRDHQTELISHLMGGPITYTGRDLHVAHRHLKIQSDDYDSMIAVLKTTLLTNNIRAEDIKKIMGLIEKNRESIISK